MFPVGSGFSLNTNVSFFHYVFTVIVKFCSLIVICISSDPDPVLFLLGSGRAFFRESDADRDLFMKVGSGSRFF